MVVMQKYTPPILLLHPFLQLLGYQHVTESIFLRVSSFMINHGPLIIRNIVDFKEMAKLMTEKTRTSVRKHTFLNREK